MAIDIKLFYFLNGFTGKSRIIDHLIVFFASYLQYILIAFFILFLFFSAYPARKKIFIFFVVMASAIISRFGVTEIIRFLYHRPRPFLVLSNAHQLLSDKEWSFPSGHSAFFFAMAVAIYFYNKKLGIGFFIASIFLNFGRVMAGIHYPSDILGGMLVGIIVACFVVWFAKKMTNQLSPKL